MEKKHLFYSRNTIHVVLLLKSFMLFFSYSWFWSGYCLLSLLYLFVKVSVLPWLPEDYQGGFGVGVVGVPLFSPDWARIASAAPP